MRRLYTVIPFIWFGLAESSAAHAHGEHCSAAGGRYAIYANNDFLRISGSKYNLVVVIDALDKKLERMGWERWAADGDFVICSKKSVPPLRLTSRDSVQVRSFSSIRFIQR